ncbi:unnamed protein product [Rhizopus stolonifer]
MSYPHVPSRSPFRIRDSHKAINIASNERWSLGLELDDMWHMKPVEHHLPITHDNLFIQLLISQALLDSNDYEILSFEQVESLKKEHQDLQELIATLSRSIQVETRIKNVSRSLGNMHNSRDSVLYLEQQTQTNASRLNELMQRYEYMNIKAFDIQETLLKHTAAVLNRGTQAPEGGRTEALNRLRAIVARYDSSSESKDPLALLQSIDRRLSPDDKREPLLNKLRQAEKFLTTLYTQAELYTQKKKAFVAELKQYKDEYQMLQTRQPVKTVPNNQFGKQLEEQRSHFETNLSQQRRRVNESLGRRQEMLQKHAYLETQVAELDREIKEKSRQIDQRDVRITRIKEELKKPSDQAQRALDRREQMWTAQRQTVEKNFDTLMMDYDEIITTAMDFDSNRMRYDKKVDSLSSSIQKLEAELIEEKMKNIGQNNNTTDLRKEFRMLISDIKRSHDQRIHQQVQDNLKLRSQLEQLENEQNKLSKGHSIQVQTE